MIVEIKDPKNYLKDVKVVIEVHETSKSVWHNDMIIEVYDQDDMCRFSEPVLMLDKSVNETNQKEIN